ncbi:MAG: DUF1385 domain-containing protein [Chloroflexi bacterium]|nr:DUF1385 domain-containing protein [Chloroflexota bacterium]
MMRGRRFVACAVRDPKGNIVVTSEPISPAIYASRWAQVPFLRAVTTLWDTLVLGTKMLMYSANVAVSEESAKEAAPVMVEGVAQGSAPGAIGKVGAAKGQSTAAGAIGTGVAFGTLMVSLAFGIALFFVLPLFLVSLIDPLLNVALPDNTIASVASNIIEGLIRLIIFLAYLFTISLLPDVRRVFQYHGAEHKTIAADEAGAPLTPESVQRFSKEHPRCGTGFLLVVVVVSIVVFALLGRPPIIWRMVSRIVLVPVVAALSYELIKFSSAHRGNPLLYWLVVKPSLALQSLTTREPDAKMIEVAVAALRHVQAQEQAAPTALAEARG